MKDKNNLEVTCREGDENSGAIIVSEDGKVKEYPAVIFPPNKAYELIEKSKKFY